MSSQCKIAALLLAFAAATSANAQETGTPSSTPVPEVVRVVPAPKLSESLSARLADVPEGFETPREKREQALAKLLEGQRYVWAIKRSRSQAQINGRLAKQAFQRAVELDPNLAEGYTALAELAWNMPPNDLDEAVRLATISTKISRDNFGANRILARGFTLKSRLNRGALDPAYAEKAVQSWKEIVRLDPRNAEAWAFLSEFYADDPGKRIDALRNWLSSAQPLDDYFFRTLMGGQASLAPDGAAVRLGAALVGAGRTAEAVEVLNQVIADDPENGQGIELLGKALENADARTASTSVQAIRQAIYVNPGNNQLILLLAKVHARTGTADETARFINETVARLAMQDKDAASGLLISLGEVYRDGGRYDDSVAEFGKALAMRGISRQALAGEEDRDFAVVVYERIIGAYKEAGRFDDAKAAVLESQKVLGDEDSFTDRQLITLYREFAKRNEALQAVKYARVRFPQDYGFLRTEASILTDLGRVDEGVAIIRSLIGKQKPDAPSIMFDDFSNQLFIAILYGEAKRGKEAIAAANQALALASDEERKQIAQLTLATGLQVAGDFAGAEATLRALLKRSPGNPIALNNLGYFLVERDEKLDEALVLIGQAVEIDPENASYLDSLGWAYFKLGNLELAETNLKKALKSDPISATILDHLGDVFDKKGRADEARRMWQRALLFATDPEQSAAIRQKLAGKKTR
jgi:tetratricopeptide (TPR) repeat protein